MILWKGVLSGLEKIFFMIFFVEENNSLSIVSQEKTEQK